MSRTTILFTVAILAPSLLLGGLALRSAAQQQVVIEQQAVDLYQALTDQLSLNIGSRLALQQRRFDDYVDGLLATGDPTTISSGFNEQLKSLWPDAATGFAVTLTGELLSPAPGTYEAEVFAASNGGFLSPRGGADFIRSVQTIWSQSEGQFPLTQSGNQSLGQRKIRPKQQRQQQKVEVVPPQVDEPASTAPALPFQEIVATGISGSLSRLVNDRVEILYWKRAALDSRVVLGANLLPLRLKEVWQEALDAVQVPADEVCLVILDERARPIATSDPDFEADWEQPFVAAGVGDLLPHWEAALYLRDPGRFGRQGRTAQATILMTIVLALAVIVTGASLMARETQRRVAWARARSDFVSTVSHELKTPLTSIRMFADLLARRPAPDAEKSTEFVRVIRLEAERLSRLVDNVLDFDKLQRGERSVRVEPFDAYEVVRRVWASSMEPLGRQGYDVRWEAADPPWLVLGDADATAQILINLASNAEKYAASTREILLRADLHEQTLTVELLDRGDGISPANAKKLFEPFFREDPAHERGVSGSGLGLHIARQLARAQGGRLTFRPRPGGGSIFALELTRALDDRTGGGLDEHGEAT